MAEIATYIAEVAAARRQVVLAVHDLTFAQQSFHPGPAEWSPCQVVEHLVLAEHGGIIRLWQAADGVRQGKPVWNGEPIHRGLLIEEIISRTWKPQEQAPPNATPQTDGPLAYWVACLQACQAVLEDLGDGMQGLDLTMVIAPHFLSGPLDAIQRLQFLRWHLHHHLGQVEELKEAPEFPRRT